jgi:hypothetical protein
MAPVPSAQGCFRRITTVPSSRVSSLDLASGATGAPPDVVDASVAGVRRGRMVLSALRGADDAAGAGGGSVRFGSCAARSGAVGARAAESGSDDGVGYAWWPRARASGCWGVGGFRGWWPRRRVTTVAADGFLPLDEVGLRCLAEANGVNVSYPPGTNR